MLFPTTRIRRVPEVTALFWVLKLLTTGIGETSSDFLVKTLDPVPVVLVAAVVFAGSLLIQLSAGRYVPWRYWLFVLMVAIFGTMVADVTHIVFEVPYAISSAAFLAVLVALLVVWRRAEGTISVHSIDSRRRELFYWAVVLATFALGTAFGDLTATTLGLGYWGSAILFAVVFGIPLLLHSLGVAETLTFWAAYIVTRPLGASVADGLAVEPARGGLGFGTALVSIIGLVVIAAVVAVIQVRSRTARG
ncbi:MAG: hypothetical protein ABI435_02285 [Pseudolysinimonas sp.]